MIRGNMKRIIGNTVGTAMDPQTLVNHTEHAEKIEKLISDVANANKVLANKIDGAYADELGYLYLTSGADVVVGPIGPFAGGGGGSSENNATLSVVNTSGWISTTTTEKSSCCITFTWRSVENGLSTGNGSVNVKVNGTSKLTKSIAQGDVSLDIMEYLSVGDNVIRVTVSDVYGNSKILNLNVEVVSFSLTSPFDESTRCTGSIQFPYIPVGNAEKTMYFILDGKEIGTATITASGRQTNFLIPKQTHGAHRFEVYFIAVVNDVEVESNHLVYDIMFVDEASNVPIIASSFDVKEIEQYYSVTIPYSVYNPASLTTEIKLLADGEEVKTLNVDRTKQLWTYRLDNEGTTVLEIATGNVKKSFSINVTETNIDVSAEESDLGLYLTSYGRSNAESNPATWGYKDIFATFENFNFVSDGWQNDKDNNVVLRVAGDARLNIPFNIFGEDFRTTGKTIEFEFATRDVMNYDTEIISCMDGGKGITFTAQKVTLKSEQSELFVQYKEDEHIRVSFVIEKTADNRLIYVYVDGIISGVIQYPANDDFQQSNPVGISIGSNDCAVDLYNIRVYNNNLTRYQILDNWIADTQAGHERLQRFGRNNIYDAYGKVITDKLPSDLPYMMLVGSALPDYKGDKKDVSGYYVDPLNSKKSFTFDNSTCDVQGTSSQYYKRKNYKIKFKNGFIVNGETKETYQLRDDSIGVDTFTYKADVASSEGANNVVLAKLYNDICPYKTPAQIKNPKVRQGIDGLPMVMFWDSGAGATFLGKYNFNNDKATEEVFGFEAGDESWEIKNNTSARSLFKSADFRGTAWLEDFEGRYPDGNTDSTKLAEVSAWIVSTDQSQATGKTLAKAVTYGDVEYTKDTAEYRLAKFKAEAEDWLELESWIFNYVFTDVFLMVDSRAKNVFPTYYAGGKLCVLPYDYDTGIGINNEGLLVFNYNLEDTDKVNGSNVYNGQDSVLYINLREAFGSEIEKMYQTLRSSGKLSYEEVERRFEEHQNLWSEAIFNEDAYVKYIEPLVNDGEGTYLSMGQGPKKSHRKWWLYNRFRYKDSKHTTGDALSHTITLRAYQKSDFVITPYSDIYPCVAFDSTKVKARGNRNVACNIVSPETWDPHGSDAVVTVYSANELKSVGDLAPFKVGYADFSKAIKLQSIKVGDSSEEYRNENLAELYVGNNTLLTTLDVRNCPNLAQAVDVSGCSNIEHIYFDGTAITGLVLPNGGNIKTLHLPATLTNLTIRNQKAITDFVLPTSENVTTLWLENVSEVIDIYDIVTKLPANSRVRLIGFDFSVDSSAEILEFYRFLDTMRGLDEKGQNIDKVQLSGVIRVDSITGSELAEMLRKYPDVQIIYQNISSYLRYYNHDGSALLRTEELTGGANGSGYDATRESTAQYHFSHIGWSTVIGGEVEEDALNNVVMDRNVYAVFEETLRTYSVHFYNTGELHETVENVPYGGSAVPTKEDPVNNSTGNPDDFKFTGWLPKPENITGETYCFAQYEDNRMIEDSWATMLANANNGTATSTYGLGRPKTLDLCVGNLPYSFINSSAVVLNGEIHIMGSADDNKSHYKWNGSEWISVSTLPYDFYGSAVVLNDEIHILGSYSNQTKHYKWNGTEWASVSTLPYNFYNGSAVVLNDEIHILGGNTSATLKKKHYKWNGTEWVSVSTLPYEFAGASATVYNNEIHIFGSSSTSYKKNHYKWNGAEWVSVSTLPYSFSGASVVMGSEIHIMGLGTYNNTHYKWNGTEWVSVSTLPYNYLQGAVVVCNGDIHIMGGTNNTTAYYKWNGEEWVKNGISESVTMQVAAHNTDAYPDGVTKWRGLGNLPYNFSYGSAIVHNNEVHLLGGGSYAKQHRKWSGTEWVLASELPYNHSQGSAVVYNGEIHLLGGAYVKTAHYKWTGTEWTSVSILPYEYQDGSAVVLNGEIHIIGSNYGDTSGHYKWDGTEWIKVSTLPYEYYGGSAVVLNGEIHLLGNRKNAAQYKAHYKWNGSEWVSVSELPYEFYCSPAVVLNGEIHILASHYGSHRKLHYKWNGTEWVSVSELPYNFYYGSAVVYNDKIHILGGDGGTNKFYSFDEKPVATLTFVGKYLLKDKRPLVNMREYLNGDFISLLPAELQTALTEVKKVTNGEVTNDKVWLLSAEEVADGTEIYPAIFTDASSRMKTTMDGTPSKWWLRSGEIVDENGAIITADDPNEAQGVLVGFSIG